MRSPKKNVLVGLAAVLVMLLALVSTVSAQDATPTPPTWTPPDVVKIVEDVALNIGDSTTFNITVMNDSAVGGPTWYNVTLTDVLDPAFRIDAVSTTRGTYSIVDNTVIVDGSIVLAPQESFVVSITVTLVGPVEPGTVIVNRVTVDYTDVEDNPQPPLQDEEEVVVEEGPPVIPEASTLILLGSAASGLTAYVGLQLRARRRKA